MTDTLRSDTSAIRSATYMAEPRAGDLPLPKADRRGVALCLSGGGFRATLFHLGALRRLNEFGILGRLHTVSSVSGGSITAAVLASAIPWPLAAPLSDAEWARLVADPLRAFTRRNIRTGPLLGRLLNPLAWFEGSPAVEGLGRRYTKDLTPKTLADLPARPTFIFCATDMAFGVNWEFARSWMGDYLAGEVTPHPGEWPIGRAVAASSCFPPVFNPMRIRFPSCRFTGGSFPPGEERDRILADLRLTDGGNYDNLGLEPVWKTHAIVLGSDGGALFQREPDPRLLWKRLSRYLAISDNQSRALRKRWLIASFKTGVMDGAYWGIGSARSSYDKGDTLGYSKALARMVIARIRTDLDAFSEAEAAVLENHGYLLADKAVRTHVPQLVSTAAPDLRVPHDEWMDVARVQRALAESHRRQILGRRS